MSSTEGAKYSSEGGRQPVRLYQKGVFVAYKSGCGTNKHHTSLIKIDGVKDMKDTEFYMGKRIAYIYKAQNRKNGSNFRVIWGKVTKSHGSNGVVKAKFRTNLPPKALGAQVRVMMYPSRV